MLDLWNNFLYCRSLLQNIKDCHNKWATHHIPDRTAPCCYWAASPFTISVIPIKSQGVPSIDVQVSAWVWPSMYANKEREGKAESTANFVDLLGFCDSSVVKNLPAKQQTWVQSLGWEVPLEEEMATHSSILAWEIPWTEETRATAESSMSFVDLLTLVKTPYKSVYKQNLRSVQCTYHSKQMPDCLLTDDLKDSCYFFFFLLKGQF